MTLWLIMTLMILLALALIAWPFWTGKRGKSGSSSDVYRAQLSEIEREETSGIVSANDARLARIEVQRRLIASTEDGKVLADNPMNASDRMTFLGVAALVLLGSGLIYMNVGRPDLKSAARSGSAWSSENAQLGLPSSQAAGQATPGNVNSVESMIQSLEQRLQKAPDDVEGWRMLGWPKFRTDDYSGARDAYAKAAELEPENPLILSVYGEAMISAQGGFVSDEARAILEKTLSLDPKDPRARFLLGLGKEQAGDAMGALDAWLALLEDGNPDEAWFGEVRERVVELSTSSGIDVSDRLPPAPAAQPGNSPTPTAGPTPEQIRDAQAMTPEARQAMIQNMVNGLDARLREDPNDLEGWIKLINSRRILGQDALAKSALADAQSAFAQNPDALARLSELVE